MGNGYGILSTKRGVTSHKYTPALTNGNIFNIISPSMSGLKVFGLTICSFLLFIVLIAFGITFTVNSTALNPNFIGKVLDRIDVSNLVSEAINEEMNDGDEFPEELKTAIVDTITNIEPVIKQEIDNAVHEIYQYLLKDNRSPDLRSTLGNTFLNPDFVDSLVSEIDIPVLLEQILEEQESSDEPISVEMKTAIIDTVTEMEDSIKTQLVAASEPIFYYLLEETPDLDLEEILRNTFLSNEFVELLIGNLNASALLSDMLGDQLAQNLPGEVAYLSDTVDEAIAAVEPQFKQELLENIDQILDYLLGARPDIHVEIALGSINTILEDIFRDAFMESPPPEVAGMSQTEINQVFDDYFALFINALPSTFTIDSSFLGSEVHTQIAEGISDAEEAFTEARENIGEAITSVEDNLEEVRGYVNLFQIIYWATMGLAVVFILGIILISRNMKDSCLTLGTVFTIYGVLEYTGLLIGKNFLKRELLTEDIPNAVADLPIQLISDVTAPLQMLSLGLAILGVALIIFSVTYLRIRQASLGGE